LFPDGSPLFLQSRQKKRRPFTAEEDRALKEGYDRHGTVWATIVKDPVFREQGRRSTDLRDRFRNAWPELYAKAGYKPRAHAAKKKRTEKDAMEDPVQGDGAAGEHTHHGIEPVGFSGAEAAVPLATSAERVRVQPMRAATDDQLPTTSTPGVGPVRRRRHTTQGFSSFRSGTKSVPESVTNTDDEASDNDIDLEDALEDHNEPEPSSKHLQSLSATVDKESPDIDMDISSQESIVPDMLSSSSLSMSDMTDASSQARTSWPEIDTTLHQWSSVPTSSSQGPSPCGQSQSTVSTVSVPFAESLAASPTSTDYLLPNSPNAHMTHAGMIGKSAWGPQDWLSPNPRLDGGGTSFPDPLFSPSPVGSPSLYSSAGSTHHLSLAQLSLSHLAYPLSSGSQGNPYSFGHSSHLHSQAFTHGVMDRYDLFPPSSHLRDGHEADDCDVDTLDLDFTSEGFDAASSDVQSAFSDPAWPTGNARRGWFTHHSSQAGDLIFGARTHQPTGHLAGFHYGLGFGFGALGAGGDMGLGLEGTQGTQGILHTPALPGIDEIELTSISLNDPLPGDKSEIDMAMEDVVDPILVSSAASHESSGCNSELQDQFQPLALDDIVGIPLDTEGQEGSQSGTTDEIDTSHHITPPATPGNAFRSTTRSQSGLSLQQRSVSVPPSEHRAFLPPRSGQSQVTSPKAKYRSLMMTPTRSSFAVPQLPSCVPVPASMSISPRMTTTQTSSEPKLEPHGCESENYDLPFLDLHYYTSNDFPSMSDTFPGGSVQLGAQALDLAHTLMPLPSQSNPSGHKQLCIPPSLVHQPLQTIPAGYKQLRSPPSHHQGHSAAVVSPQDVFVYRGNDNKRKRASWDGGPK
jgi:hypothetical protein